MLLIDGIRYHAWAPKDEDELEEMVKEHARDIFGADCLYFGRKHKLKSGSVAAIPDGYAITFNPDRWWIVEVELSTHPVYEHIQNQVGRFIAALSASATRPELVRVLWDEINADAVVKAVIQKTKGGELYKWLTDLINQPPELAIIIDTKAPGLDDAVAALKIQPRVVEFATYARDSVGLTVHGHRFEPLWQARTDDSRISPQDEIQKAARPKPQLSEERPPDKNPRRVTVKDLLGAGLLTLNQKIFHVYRGTRYEGLILADGMIRLQHDDSTHRSPSGAAGHITYDSRHSMNGWTWWKTIDEKGNEVLLNNLWHSYVTMRRVQPRRGQS